MHNANVNRFAQHFPPDITRDAATSFRPASHKQFHKRLFDGRPQPYGFIAGRVFLVRCVQRFEVIDQLFAVGCVLLDLVWIKNERAACRWIVMTEGVGLRHAVVEPHRKVIRQADVTQILRRDDRAEARDPGAWPAAKAMGDVIMGQDAKNQVPK